MSDTNPNTTDVTVGESLRVRVMTRKAEIEARLAKPGRDVVTPDPDDRTRRDLQMALSEVTGLLTGDLDRIPKVVAAELNTWLEASKHLDEHHPASRSK